MMSVFSKNLICKLSKSIAMITVLIVGVWTNATIAGKLYKWTDEKGIVHYADKLPPNKVKDAHKQLDDQGLVREESKPAKTDEERLAEKIQSEQELQERRRLAEIEARKRRRDQILLDTFTIERDLIITRDDRLNSVDSSINLTEINNKRLLEQIEETKQKIERTEKSGKDVPENFKKKLANLQGQYDKNFEFLSLKRQEREQLDQRFKDDLKRFRELKGLEDSETADKEKSPEAGKNKDKEQKTTKAPEAADKAKISDKKKVADNNK
jgi:hypothetical protein